VEGTMNHFNRIYRFLWITLIFLIMYLSSQRNAVIEGGSTKVMSAFSSSPVLSTITIILLISLTGISVLRAIEARNQWRKIAEEDSVDEVLDQIEKKDK